MARLRPNPLGVPAAVRAIASPVRQEVVDALLAAGPRTIAELGTLLGRPADGLYFHVRALMKVGLVVEKEPRREGRHVSAVYDVVERPLRLSYDGPVRRKDIERVVRGAVRLSLRDFRHGLAGDAATDGPRRALWGGRAKGWISEEELQEINALLTRVHEVLHAGRPREGARCMSLGFVLAPAKTNARARGAGARKGKTVGVTSNQETK